MEKKAETMAVHHPCKTIHNDETQAFNDLLEAAGVTGKTAGKSPAIPSCCGGGGGGFLWDSPAKVSQARWKSLEEETGENKVVTGCPGCHRMLGVAKSEEGSTSDIANVIYERLKSNIAKVKATENQASSEESSPEAQASLPSTGPSASAHPKVPPFRLRTRV